MVAESRIIIGFILVLAGLTAVILSFSIGGQSDSLSLSVGVANGLLFSVGTLFVLGGLFQILFPASGRKPGI